MKQYVFLVPHAHVNSPFSPFRKELEHIMDKYSPVVLVEDKVPGTKRAFRAKDAPKRLLRKSEAHRKYVKDLATVFKNAEVLPEKGVFGLMPARKLNVHDVDVRPFEVLFARTKKDVKQILNVLRRGRNVLVLRGYVHAPVLYHLLFPKLRKLEERTGNKYAVRFVPLGVPDYGASGPWELLASWYTLYRTGKIGKEEFDRIVHDYKKEGRMEWPIIVRSGVERKGDALDAKVAERFPLARHVLINAASAVHGPRGVEEYLRRLYAVRRFIGPNKHF